MSTFNLWMWDIRGNIVNDMREMNRLRVAIAWAVLLIVLTPQFVSAQEHPLIQRARLASDRAEFEQASDILAELPQDLNLTTTDLREALVLRATIFYALENVQAMERTLASIARFTSPEELPDDLPPILQERIEAHRSANEVVFVNLTSERTDEGVNIEVRSTPPDDLVNRVRLFVRGGEEYVEWTAMTMEGSSVNVAIDDDLEFYAELIGLGGAVLAHSGTRQDPHLVAAPEGPLEQSRSRRRIRAWPFIVAAVVVAAALGVGLGVGLTRDQEERVQLGTPTVSW